MLCVISCSSFPCACHVTKSSLLCFELFCFGFAAAFLSIWSLWPEAKGLRQVSHACGVGAQTNSNIHNTHTHIHTHSLTQIAALFFGNVALSPFARSCFGCCCSRLRLRSLNHINEFSFGHVFFCACSAALIMQN